ncbi:hypothetical protein HFP57_12290 [Parasphingopyxis algicola]|uniref:hypothetical protein n=1 Tax=Parasphingopyxis algicola TaxID=2026624 RepID=UPI0015A2DAEF|nr:hypothetical protein [Parasphingopyxis algicola]QLC25719.1 hypothetical protein HFP57_12290 [Parasphingopyxis algicola]
MSNIERTASAITAAAALAAMAPGVAMLLDIVEIPPSAAQLTKALSLAVGVVAVFTIMILRRSVERIGDRTTLIVCTVSLILGIILAISYYQVSGRMIVDFVAFGEEQRVILPLSPSDDLQSYEADFGSYPEALVNPIVGQEVREKIEQENGSTVPALIFLVLMAQISLLIAIVVAALKFLSSNREAEAEAP